VKFGVPLDEVCKNDIPGPLLVSSPHCCAILVNFLFSVLSFGCFPGIWFILADVLEHSVCSIFKADDLEMKFFIIHSRLHNPTHTVHTGCLESFFTVLRGCFLSHYNYNDDDDDDDNNLFI
jgi:hypothetical protein